MRGHQDDKTKYGSLSIHAKLNVQADHLTEAYYEIGTPSKPMVNILPSSPAMISIRGVSITSDYQNQLIKAYTEPE